MIKIKKTSLPSTLEAKCKQWTLSFSAALAEGNKEKQRELKGNYSHLKAQLVADSYGKCAYCESFVRHISAGQTEHILPVSNNPTLVFDWNNLVLACENCNRNKNAYDDSQNPMINPITDEPSQFFDFVGPYMNVFGPKGEVTKKEIDLNRKDLVGARIESLESIKQSLLRISETQDPQRRAWLVRQIKKEYNEEKSYSYMKRCFIASELIRLSL